MNRTSTYIFKSLNGFLIRVGRLQPWHFKYMGIMLPIEISFYTFIANFRIALYKMVYMYGFYSILTLVIIYF